MIVGIIYASPEGSSSYSGDAIFEQLTNYLAGHVQRNPELTIILCGDFNARTANDDNNNNDFITHKEKYIHQL